MSVASSEPSRLPSLPTVFLLGCGKCASTSMWKALVAQPELCPATPVPPMMAIPQKEVHFFDNAFGRYSLGIVWCSSNFNRSRTDIWRAEDCRFVDGSPSYLNFEGTAARIHQSYPPPLRSELRLIALVREPVSLLVSHFDYFHNFEPKMRNKTFEQWIGSWAQHEVAKPLPPHLRVGLFYEQLLPYWTLFTPAMVFMLDMHVAVTNFSVALGGISRFLGLHFSINHEAKLPSVNRGGAHEVAPGQEMWWRVGAAHNLPHRLCRRLATAHQHSNQALLEATVNHRRRGLEALGQPVFEGFDSNSSCII